MHTRPGIHHLEFWVGNLQQAVGFYGPLLTSVGWTQRGDSEFSSGATSVYFIEKPVRKADTVGPRHVCFQARSRGEVDAVAELLRTRAADIIRGPVEMPEYSEGYYTVDFRDPDGYVIEVAHTPS